MEKLTVDALNQMVDNIINENYDAIKHNIFCTITSDMDAEKLFSTVMMNCLSETMKRTLQLNFEVLQSAGILGIDERGIAKQLLKQLSSEIED